jgi:hypothetical protein
MMIMRRNGSAPRPQPTAWHRAETRAANAVAGIGLWAATAAAAASVDGMPSEWSRAVGAAAVVAAICLPGRAAARALTVLAVAPVTLVEGPPWWYWIVAAAALGAATALDTSEARPRNDDLHRHLEWARRGRERVTVLVAELSELERSRLDTLQGSLRLTDILKFVVRGRGVEPIAVLDEDGLDRRAVEARLARLAGTSISAGWATFPEDGLKLEVLVAAARAATVGRAGRAAIGETRPRQPLARAVAREEAAA